MSGRNSVTVILDAIDKLSPVLKGIQNNTQNLGAGAVFMGNMYTSAFQAAANAAGKLVDHFGEASDMQTSAIGLAGQFSAMTGKSYAAAGEMIKGMTADFSQMAAKLPGATQDYKNLGLAISDTLIKANTVDGVFNEEAFKKQTMSLTETLGLLKATNSELTTTDIQLFFTKFSEGASASELQILKLNERMPGLMGELEKASKKLYGEGKKMEDLTLAQRTKIMEVATRGLAPPEMVKDLEKTASSQIEAFKTTLFDQDTGIFGFLRSVKTVNGKSKTVMDSFASLLAGVFGEDGLFTVAGNKLKESGINFDPMLALHDGVMMVSGWVKKAGDFLKKLPLPKMSEVGKDGDIGKTLGEQYSKGVQWVRDSVGKMVSDGTFKDIGSNIGNMFNSGIKFIGDFFRNTDWGALAESAANMISGAVDAVIAFLSKIDWGQVAQTFGAVIQGFITFATKFGEKIRGNLLKKGGEILGNIAKWAGEKLSELSNAIKDNVAKWITSIKDSVMGIFGGKPSAQESTSQPTQQSQPSTPAASVVTENLFSSSGSVFGFAKGLNVGGLFSAIAAESRAMPSGAGIAIANTSETILNRSQQSDLVASLSRSKSSGGVFAPQITVNPSPGMDERSLANMVLAELDARWKQYQLASV